MRPKLSKDMHLEKAKEVALSNLQPFIDQLRNDVIPNIPSDSKLHKLFLDSENKVYEVMKKIVDEVSLLQIKTEEEKEAAKTGSIGREEAGKKRAALIAGLEKRIEARKKRALDAVNEELGKPTYEPRADFDRQDSPFFSKGLENNSVAPDQDKSAAFEQMPKEFTGTLVELGELAQNQGYFRAKGNANNVYFLKKIEDQPFDFEILYKKVGDKWQMSGGEVRVKHELAPSINQFVRSQTKRVAEIKQHTAPKILPPRDDIRTHMDQDVKKELDNDPDMQKDSKLAQLKAILANKQSAIDPDKKVVEALDNLVRAERALGLAQANLVGGAELFKKILQARKLTNQAYEILGS